jgi:hypothetical protein
MAKSITVGCTVYHAYLPGWGPGKVVGSRDGGYVVKFRDIDRGRNPNPVRIPADHLRHPRKKK